MTDEYRISFYEIIFVNSHLQNTNQERDLRPGY
jgi:hypothetical protein